jgi:hypothetical protein
MRLISGFFGVGLLTGGVAFACVYTRVTIHPGGSGSVGEGLGGAVGGAPLSGSAGSSGQPSCVPGPSAHVMTPDAKIPQQSDVLCWAASAEMVAHTFQMRNDQCDQLREYPSSSCTACSGCMGSSSVPYGACNHGGWPHFERVHIHAEKTTDKALSLDELKREIACNRHPVAFTWHTGPFSGHMMVAYGYDGDLIDVANPLEVCVGDTFTIDWDTYNHGDNPDSSHWDDFYGFRKE